MLKYVLGFFAVAFVAMGFFMFYGMSDIKAMSIGEINLASIKDGTYKGSYSKGRWNYNVSVTVKDHKITAINMLDEKMKMAEKVSTEQISRVIDKQSTKVDVVSGATVFSKIGRASCRERV